MVKWGLFDPESYYYRTTGRVMIVKMLDLFELNKSFITIDTIWFAIRLSDVLEDCVFDETIFQFAYTLIR